MKSYPSIARGWHGARLLGICALAVCLGCQDSGDPRKYHVSGTVTYGGAPVPTGAIVFEPDSRQGNSGPAGFAAIKDGAFDTRQSGKGVVGGPHLVKIHGTDGKQDDDLGLFPAGKPLFSEHVIEIDLPEEESSHEFEVPEQ